MGHDSHIDSQQAPGGVSPDAYFSTKAVQAATKKPLHNFPLKEAGEETSGIPHLVSNSPMPLTSPCLFPLPTLTPVLGFTWSCLQS